MVLTVAVSLPKLFKLLLVYCYVLITSICISSVFCIRQGKANKISNKINKLWRAHAQNLTLRDPLTWFAFLCILFWNFQAIFGLGSALVDCLSFFAFLRFFASAFAVGLFVAHYIFALELFGPTYRTRADKLQNPFWTIGAGLIALLGYLIPDWRTLLILCSFPPLLLFSIYK